MISSGFDFNAQFAFAYDLLENSRSNIFITGRAGTGKSTLLQYFREHTTKNVAVLAPTGVAAVNVKGQTIHSFFHFKPDITPEKVEKIRLRRENKEIYAHLETVVIDEASMMRSDLLDCVDAFLRLHGPKRKEHFGGVQMIFIGDLYQLPPVVSREEGDLFHGLYASPYFFDAKVFEQIAIEFIDLAKIYRQQDDDFIELLNAVRNRSVSEDHLKRLNRRYLPDFHSPKEDFYIYLTTTNALAESVNMKYLAALDAKAYHYEGKITGKFEMKNLPTQPALDFKIGAQVMLLNNDPQGRWVNGSIGKIFTVAQDLTSTDIVGIELEGGRKVEVTPFTWEMFRFFYNEAAERLESESVGSFSQYPLKLAWAVTIHKSQGKTFSKVIIDIGEGTFAHGQAYVALSRCTSLGGIVLKRPILKRHILLDERVKIFMSRWDAAPALAAG